MCTHLRDSLFHKWSPQMENVIQDDDASLTQQGEDQAERERGRKGLREGREREKGRRDDGPVGS